MLAMVEGLKCLEETFTFAFVLHWKRVYQYSEWLLGSHKREHVVILGIYYR